MKIDEQAGKSQKLHISSPLSMNQDDGSFPNALLPIMFWYQLHLMNQDVVVILEEFHDTASSILSTIIT